MELPLWEVLLWCLRRVLFLGVRGALSPLNPTSRGVVMVSVMGHSGASDMILLDCVGVSAEAQ
jgi:hypothetical protein